MDFKNLYGNYKLFDYQTGFINLIIEFIILFLIFKESGHLICLILSLILKSRNTMDAYFELKVMKY